MLCFDPDVDSLVDLGEINAILMKITTAFCGLEAMELLSIKRAETYSISARK